MVDKEELRVGVLRAWKQFRSAARRYRKEGGGSPSKLMSGGASNVPIEDRLLSTAVCVAVREYLLPLVPPGGIACEVGTSTGFFSRAIVRTMQPREMHLVDMDYSRFEHDRYMEAASGKLPHRHEGMSWVKLAEFESFFDFIYIDAAHDYPSVKKDISAALKAIKPTGYLMFNDYTRWSIEQVEPYGVPAAVNEMANVEGWAFRGIALSGSGHYDVLLSRANAEMDAIHERMVQEWRGQPRIEPEKYVRKRSVG